MLVAFYVMIVRLLFSLFLSSPSRTHMENNTNIAVAHEQALVSWFYEGQPLVHALLNQCAGVGAPAGEGGGAEGGATGAAFAD
jgi:hypothetical protein